MDVIVKVLWKAVEIILIVVFGFGPYVLMYFGIKKLRENQKWKGKKGGADAQPVNKIGFQQAMAGGGEKKAVKKLPTWPNYFRKIARRFLPSKLYHTFSVGGFPAAYFFDYCPDRADRDVRDERNRSMILGFKDGKNETAIHLVTEFIFNYIPADELDSWMLCVIPASTRAKNEARNRHFCEGVSRISGIQNGYKEIIILFDRTDSREKKTDDTTSNLQFGNGFEGKKVLLFDDIVTRGVSFMQCAEEIMGKGAESVTGLFLGRTLR